MDSCRDCLNWSSCEDDDKNVCICDAYEKRQRWSSACVTIEDENDDTNK